MNLGQLRSLMSLSGVINQSLISFPINMHTHFYFIFLWSAAEMQI